MTSTNWPGVESLQYNKLRPIKYKMNKQKRIDGTRTAENAQ